MPRPAISFEPMSSSDLPVVMPIEKGNYSFPWTEDIFKKCLFSGYQCWLMKIGEELAGYSILSMKGDQAHLLNLSINPDQQGKGLGRRFLRFMLKQAENLNAAEVFLEVRISNLHAHQLYVSEGFNEVGQNKGYYPSENAREDAVVLAFNLL